MTRKQFLLLASLLVHHVAHAQEVKIVGVLVSSNSEDNHVVELHNTGSEEVDISGWTLLRRKDGYSYNFGTFYCQESTILEPNGHITVHGRGNEEIDECGFAFDLDESEDEITLSNASGVEVDTIKWRKGRVERMYHRSEARTGEGSFHQIRRLLPRSKNLRDRVFDASADQRRLAEDSVCKFGTDNPYAFETPQVGAEVSESLRMDEISGLASSIANPGVLWVHEDDENALLYALASEGPSPGRTVATLSIGVQAEDLEDIAVAKCPDGITDCIWLADTGDNCAREIISEAYNGGEDPNCTPRGTYTVWAIEEPVLEPSSLLPSQLYLFPGSMEQKVWTFRFTLNGGEKRDFESLLVKPDGSQFILLERTRLCCPAVYASIDLGSFSTGTVTVLELDLVTEISNPPDAQLSSADFHPGGTEVVVATPREGIYVYNLQTPFDLSTAGSPLLVAPVPLAPQLEGIAYAPVTTTRAAGLWMASESDVEDRSPPLLFLSCPGSG